MLAANTSDGWQFEGWAGSGAGSYSGTSSDEAVTLLSPIVENATFYPGLDLVTSGPGQITYQWGVNQGRLSSGAFLYVPAGTNVTLTAAPASPFFTFNGYSGSIASGSTISSIIVDGPATVKTSFSLSYGLLFALFGSIGVVGVGLAYYLRRTSSSMSR